MFIDGPHQSGHIVLAYSRLVVILIVLYLRVICLVSPRHGHSSSVCTLPLHPSVVNFKVCALVCGEITHPTWSRSDHGFAVARVEGTHCALPAGGVDNTRNGRVFKPIYSME